MFSKRVSVAVVALLMVVPLLPAGAGAVAGSLASPLHAPAAPAVIPPVGAFAAVTNFEDGHMDGWHAAKGSASISTSVTYLGEPSLLSSTVAPARQVNVLTKNFVTGDKSLSFQAVVHYGAGGRGFVGLGIGSQAVAVVGVGGGKLWAGPDPAHVVSLGSIPTTGTAQPTGWVEFWVQLTATTPHHPASSPWTMDVYVDRTDQSAATGLSLPDVGNYTGAVVVTTSGTVAYSNLIFTTYGIPTLLPGYNNMDGYGQGSGLLVSVLPAFTVLRSTMTLTNWNVPQRGILSFQINAMNYSGTVKSTCRGFFQLGIDLDPNGHIAPWYVKGTNCVAFYFATNTSAISGGFKTPPGSVLTLAIIDHPALHTIEFTIVDTSITGTNRVSDASIPYTGSEFFGSYTQIEWQPCCSHTPISSYFFNGSLSHLRISGGNLSGVQNLDAQYMLPFALDVPPSWNLGYYVGKTASYDQVG